MPDWPVGLNGEFAPIELPGVVVNCWHVVFDAPGWPGPFGLFVAKTVPDVIGRSNMAALPSNNVWIRMIPVRRSRVLSTCLESHQILLRMLTPFV